MAISTPSGLLVNTAAFLQQADVRVHSSANPLVSAPPTEERPMPLVTPSGPRLVWYHGKAFCYSFGHDILAIAESDFNER